MSANLNTVYVIVARELIKFVREKGRLVSTIARPLLWLFLVGGGMTRLVSPDMGIPYIQFIFPGIIGMTILFSAIFSSISIIWDKEFGFMKEMLVAPVSRFSIVLGKALSGILVLFPFVGLHLSALQFASVLAISVILSFCISALGIFIATFYESFESFSVIMNFIVMPMFFLSGAMYPVKLLPPLLGALSMVNPLTYGIDALKYVILPRDTLSSAASPLTHDFPFFLDLSVIMIASVVFVIIAGYVFERRK
jgi:ABC-2 type transport system permease protein